VHRLSLVAWLDRTRAVVLIWCSIRLKLLNEMGFTLSSAPENNATVKLLIRKSHRTTQITLAVYFSALSREDAAEIPRQRGQGRCSPRHDRTIKIKGILREPGLGLGERVVRATWESG
jgi:hypothetical protein